MDLYIKQKTINFLEDIIEENLDGWGGYPFSMQRLDPLQNIDKLSSIILLLLFYERKSQENDKIRAINSIYVSPKNSYVEN